MAVTELQEEDQMQADAKSNAEKLDAAEKKKTGGRVVAPIYLRKADLARFVEAKKTSFKDNIARAEEEMRGHIADAEKGLEGGVALPSDIVAAIDCAKKSIAEFDTAMVGTNKVMDEMVADESWYTEMPIKEMTARVQKTASTLTRNDKGSGGVCPLNNMMKAVSGLGKTIACRPAKTVNAMAGEALAIMVEIPVLKMLHDHGVSGKVNCENKDLGKCRVNGTWLPCHKLLADELMRELRSTPGMAGHAKWLKNQMESSKKKYLASEYKHSLRLVLQKMLCHHLGEGCYSGDLQDFPLFRVQQYSTTADHYSMAITNGGFTECRLCMVGDYIYAATKLENLPGVGIAGKREALKSTDLSMISTIENLFIQDDDAFITHVKPGTLVVTPAGYFGIMIGIHESVSTQG